MCWNAVMSLPPRSDRALLLSALRRLAASTQAGDETESEAVAKATLTVGTWLITVVATGWVTAYLILGKPASASIPLGYQIVSLGILWALRSGRVGLPAARRIELTIMLVLPFLLHASLGGFVGSGAVAAWALCTPVLAFLYGSRPGRWITGFAGLAALAVVFDPLLADRFAPLPALARAIFFAVNLLAVGVVIHLGITYATAERDRRRRELAAAYRSIEAERVRADELLMSIMPADVARRLKAGEQRIADRIPHATVLAADIAGFTSLADRLSPGELVEVVDALWTRFDRMAGELGLEKIKSVGDAYLVVGGLDPSRRDQTAAVVELGIAMCEPMPVPDLGSIALRVGIASGPVVAGVIGIVRPAFGLWGDAVNTASRMESTGVPGRVQVTQPVYEEVGHQFDFELRGTVDVKGKDRCRPIWSVLARPFRGEGRPPRTSVEAGP
jgi:guanylate cyclase